MNLLELSDLHTETASFNVDYITKENVDVVAFAGDIGNKFQAMKLIQKILDKNIIVIYVLGNHEFYNINTRCKTIDDIKDGWKERASKHQNFYVLDNESVIIDNVKFIGSIGWTNLNIDIVDNEEMKFEIEDMADFRQIKKSKLVKRFKTIRGYSITVDDYQKLHDESIDFIKKEISIPFDGSKVLITHHPLLSEKKRDFTKFNTQLFYSDYTEMIKESNLDYYFHGHVHDTFSYFLDGTWVMCNPLGYTKYNEVNSLFNKLNIIKINKGLKNEKN